ncbi:MAG: rod shape-determining protein MreC [Prochlorococcus sp.]
MGASPSWQASFRWRHWRGILPWLLLVGALGLVRWSKGAGFADAYALLSRPFWPGSAQREWILAGSQLEQQAKLLLLEQDNQRLRGLLALGQAPKSGRISAAVISRTPQGWSQQLMLGKGQLDGIAQDDAVMGPGGLLGRIQSVTPTTALVQLLTAPGSRVGVWIPRSNRHGLLVGMGTSRPQLEFLDKDPNAFPGDLVSISPASTLMPANLPIGVIQSVDNRAVPAPLAAVQLIAAPEAIDWVQVQIR